MLTTTVDVFLHTSNAEHINILDSVKVSGVFKKKQTNRFCVCDIKTRMKLSGNRVESNEKNKRENGGKQ